MKNLKNTYNSYRVNVALATHRRRAWYGAIANTHTITFHSLYAIWYLDFGRAFRAAQKRIFFIVNLFYLFCSIRLMKMVDCMGFASKMAVKIKPSLSLVLFVCSVHLVSSRKHTQVTHEHRGSVSFYRRTQEIRNRKVRQCFALVQQ